MQLREYDILHMQIANQVKSCSTSTSKIINYTQYNQQGDYNNESISILKIESPFDPTVDNPICNATSNRDRRKTTPWKSLNPTSRPSPCKTRSDPNCSSPASRPSRPGRSLDSHKIPPNCNAKKTPYPCGSTQNIGISRPCHPPLLRNKPLLPARARGQRNQPPANPPPPSPPMTRRRRSSSRA